MEKITRTLLKIIIVMKKIFLTLILSCTSALFYASGQNASSWFSLSEVAPKVWVIGDHGADNMYLVEGADSALLIDTGLGTADLASFVKKLTSKPLIVVNTHGHPDHAGSNHQFRKVYVHSADSSDARACNLPEARANASKNMTGWQCAFKGRDFYRKAFQYKTCGGK